MTKFMRRLWGCLSFFLILGLIGYGLYHKKVLYELHRLPSQSTYIEAFDSSVFNKAWRLVFAQTELDARAVRGWFTIKPHPNLGDYATYFMAQGIGYDLPEVSDCFVTVKMKGNGTFQIGNSDKQVRLFRNKHDLKLEVFDHDKYRPIVTLATLSSETCALMFRWNAQTRDIQPYLCNERLSVENEGLYMSECSVLYEPIKLDVSELKVELNARYFKGDPLIPVLFDEFGVLKDQLGARLYVNTAFVSGKDMSLHASFGKERVKTLLLQTLPQYSIRSFYVSDMERDNLEDLHLKLDIKTGNKQTERWFSLRSDSGLGGYPSERRALTKRFHPQFTFVKHGMQSLVSDDFNHGFSDREWELLETSKSITGTLTHVGKKKGKLCIKNRFLNTDPFVMNLFNGLILKKSLNQSFAIELDLYQHGILQLGSGQNWVSLFRQKERAGDSFSYVVTGIGVSKENDYVDFKNSQIAGDTTLFKCVWDATRQQLLSYYCNSFDPTYYQQTVCTPITDPIHIDLSHSEVVLKAMHMELMGNDVALFDNFRCYGLPSELPVRFFLKKRFKQSIKVYLYSPDGAHSMVLDFSSKDSYSIFLDNWFDSYPAELMYVIRDAETDALIQDVSVFTRHGVEGLYPGDTWGLVY